MSRPAADNKNVGPWAANLLRPLAIFRSDSAAEDRFVINQARREATQLKHVDASELIERCNQLRARTSGRSSDVGAQPDSLAFGSGLVLEALRRSHGVELYDVQLRAGLTMCRGKIAEMQTGEGKTFSGILPSFMMALPGHGVHVCTPNSYLASRDQQQLAPVFKLLGLTTACRVETDSFEESREAYQADVTYAAGQQFGFDYLRDQWTRRRLFAAPLGTITREILSGREIESQFRGRGLFAAVIDEVDHVLIDDATSPLLISSAADRPAPDTELHLAARSVAQSLVADVHFELDATGLTLQLTDTGFRHIYDMDDFATHKDLCRAWHEYVIAALKAVFLLHRDRHYVVRDKELRLVEQSTGRIFPDRTWSGGLHQAVQAKESLLITAETSSQGRITRQAFFRSYPNLCGMTGTASQCRRELSAIYRLDVTTIPTRQPSRRRLLPIRVCRNEDEKFRLVAEETGRTIEDLRAVLIGTNHIDQSLRVAEALHRIGIRAQVLNGLQDRSEAEIVSSAGRVGTVTVATHLAGRGTDIPLDAQVAANGGLHVIGIEHHRLARVDRQLIGRGARQGDSGTARFYISPDDRFVSHHAPHLATSVSRSLRFPETVDLLSRNIESAQRKFEEQDRRTRYQQMKRNERPGKAIESAGVGQDWQLSGRAG